MLESKHHRRAQDAAVGGSIGIRQNYRPADVERPTESFRIRHTPAEMSWVARDFRFHTGEVLSELRLHYTTVGNASEQPVLILHGTTGSGSGLLAPPFAGELFGPGQVLDASKYFIILPDAIGHGKSSKPSDGMRSKFPRYNYDDMVAAQYRLVTEGLAWGRPLWGLFRKGC